MAEWILRRIYPDKGEYTSVGDFREEYYEVYQSSGSFRAHLWYWKQIIKSIPSFIQNKIHWNLIMIHNYLKVAIRNIKRHKAFSVINISGLAIGLAVSMLIMIYVMNELSYDKHIENVRNKYRVCTNLSIQDKRYELGRTVAPLAPKLSHDYPEVVNTARITFASYPFISYKDRLFYEEDVYYVDPGFFDMFSVKFIRGDSKTVFEAPFSVVLTEETAERYFGSEDPIGKILRWNNKDNYMVTGIVKRLPANTHFNINILSSFSTLYQIPSQAARLSKWMGYNYRTYIELAEGTEPESLESKFPALLKANTDENAEKTGFTSEIYLQPVTSIYLFSNLIGDYVNGNLAYIYIFSAIAVLIILIACINFMNLSTARSVNRAKEVGLRKVLGAEKKSLRYQFLGESIFLSFLSLLIAIILVVTLLPVFNRLIAADLEFNFIQNVYICLGALSLTMAAGFISGSYPAFFLSSFQPVNTLKGLFKTGKGSKFFRNILVNFQFIITVLLICGTVIIYKQLHFVENKELGFEKERLVIVPLRGQTIRQSHDVFKTELEKIPDIVKVSASSLYPGGGHNSANFTFEGHSEDEKQLMPFVQVDHDYLETIGIKVVMGRGFSEKHSGDASAVLINETLMEHLNWDDPIGKIMNQIDIVDGQPVQKQHHVIGVVKDFHFASMHTQINPLVIKLTGQVGYINARILPGKIPETLQKIEEEWKKIEPSRPFSYFFLDQTFDNFYRTEQRIGELFIYFTLIAIFIACLGLLGLSAFTAEQRTKEIGIRKVLGASVSGVVFLMSKEMIKWVALANIIAWPIAFFAMNRWLHSFAYRIDISAFIFVLSGLLTLIIAFFTVGFQSLKAARANPATTLKYE